MLTYRQIRLSTTGPCDPISLLGNVFTDQSREGRVGRDTSTCIYIFTNKKENQALDKVECNWHHQSSICSHFYQKQYRKQLIK